MTENVEKDKSFYELTERQEEVLTLIGQGLTDEEIAEKLFIEPTTVKTHKNIIYDKLHISNSGNKGACRAKAVIHAYEMGLVQVK